MNQTQFGEGQLSSVSEGVEVEPFADRMEAGRVLDALIAVEVMGWKQSERRYNPKLQPANVWVWEDAEGHIARGLRDFAPSTDIADAWQVVKAMHAKGLTFVLASSSGSPDLWEAAFDSSEGEFSEWGDTAPVAICRAALTALAR